MGQQVDPAALPANFDRIKANFFIQALSIKKEFAK